MGMRSHSRRAKEVAGRGTTAARCAPPPRHDAHASSPTACMPAAATRGCVCSSAALLVVLQAIQHSLHLQWAVCTNPTPPLQAGLRTNWSTPMGAFSQGRSFALQPDLNALQSWRLPCSGAQWMHGSLPWCRRHHHHSHPWGCSAAVSCPLSWRQHWPGLSCHAAHHTSGTSLLQPAWQPRSRQGRRAPGACHCCCEHSGAPSQGS